MQKRFVFVREDRPGEAWAARYAAGREEARRWYLGARAATVPTGPGFDWRTASRGGPTAAECREAMARHMPELLGEYDRACARAAEHELDRRIISNYRPAPDPAGCSVAAWLGDGGPALVRNYDFPPETVTGRFELTDWSGGRRVIGTAQRPWGGLSAGTLMPRTTNVPKLDTMTFRLDTATKAAITAVARAEDKPVGELLRELVRERVAESKRRNFETEAHRQSLEAAKAARDPGSDEARVMRELEADLAEFGEWR